MFDYAEFAEMVERRLSLSWRSVVSNGDSEFPRRVNATAFTMQDKGVGWEFSYSLRIGRNWTQSSKTVKPFEYDVYEPPEPDDVEGNMSPENRASDVCMDILLDISCKLGMRG